MSYLNNCSIICKRGAGRLFEDRMFDSFCLKSHIFGKYYTINYYSLVELYIAT